ncbi:MAG: hypothetical protein WCF67_07525 [Chitinophagaceae bacterium]
MLIILTLNIFIFSYDQNGTKQKELELKERELALKQNDSLNTKTITNKATVIPIADIKTNVHSDFKTFWTDFKKAVNDGDKGAVSGMTVTP